MQDIGSPPSMLETCERNGPGGMVWQQPQRSHQDNWVSEAQQDRVCGAGRHSPPLDLPLGRVRGLRGRPKPPRDQSSGLLRLRPLWVSLPLLRESSLRGRPSPYPEFPPTGKLSPEADAKSPGVFWREKQGRGQGAGRRTLRKTPPLCA